MENQNKPNYTTPDKNLLDTLSKWTNFVGIITIISGILACITIFGIVPGVISIILGLKLRNAKNSIDLYLRGQSQEINNIIENLGAYFKIQGIYIIVSLALSIIGLIIGLIFITFAMNEMSYYYY